VVYIFAVFYCTATANKGSLRIKVPPTQVSVERLFSALKILKSDHRNRLGEKMLNAMLFLRFNM
jgi:hypothetical protein